MTTERQSRFKQATAAEEAEFDIVAARHVPHPSGSIASIAHMVKGALGAGILSVHVAYMKAGLLVSLVTSLILGLYVSFSLYTLGRNAQILCKRTCSSFLTFADVGEAAFATFPNPRVSKHAKTFRYMSDFVICLELFGACCCYQLIVAKTVKQLVEDQQIALVEPQVEGYPHLRAYLAVMIIPFIAICLLRHLQWLAPFSILANAMIAFSIILTIYYTVQENPSFKNMTLTKNFQGFFEFAGMVMFSMSCVGVVLPVENNMKDPKKFTVIFWIGMTIIVLSVITAGFFGYAAYLDDCQNPITMNFPLTILPKILKVFIAIMVYITHALNFWAPFQLMFYYIEQRIQNKDSVVKWELFFRALMCLGISLLAIAFPKISSLMGFLGCFCLTNAAFIFPHTVAILLRYETGYGKCHWRLILSIFCIFIGLVLFFCGSYVNGKTLFSLQVLNEVRANVTATSTTPKAM